MTALLGILVFSGAMALSVGVILASIVPQWRRIVSLASGQAGSTWALTGDQSVAERRIAVRRWAATSCRSVRTLRAVA